MIDNRCVRISNSFTSIFNLELSCNQYKILFIILYYMQFKKVADISYRCFSEIGTARFQNRRKNNIISELDKMLELNIILHDNLFIAYNDESITVELGNEIRTCITADEYYYTVNLNDILKLTSVYTVKMYFICKRNMNRTVNMCINKFDELIGNNYADSKKYRYKVISRAISEFRTKLGLNLSVNSDKKILNIDIDGIENDYLAIE